MSAKISIIGAGSAVFSLNVIRDLCLTPSLSGCTVSFMDVDPARLATAVNLCRRYADEIGTSLRFEATTDRRTSLTGADFVVNAALVGGHRSLNDGLAIGQKHGYRFGGSYHIMHDEGFWINFYQLKLFESVVEDVLAVCPDAWYLQVANPVLAGITYLVRKYPAARIVGLCHGFGAVYRIADALGLEHEGLTYEIPGVNHFTWATHLYYKGEDVYPLLDRWIEAEAPEYWKSCEASDHLGPKAVDLYRRFGAFPVGDTCNPGGGAWPWWYHSDPSTERRWGEDPAGWWARRAVRMAKRVVSMRAVTDDPSAKVTSEFPARHSGEPIVPMIDAIACDTPRVIIANILNRGGLVPGVPEDFEVEVPTLVSKRGVEGISTQGLPGPLLAYILRDRVGPVTLELEAYKQGSRELLRQLVMMDPWSRSESQSQAFLDEILALPYHSEMREHYR